MRRHQGPSVPGLLLASVAAGIALLLGGGLLVLGTPENAGGDLPAMLTGAGEALRTRSAGQGAGAPVIRSGLRIYVADGVPGAVRAAVRAWGDVRTVEFVPDAAEAAVAVTTRASEGARLLSDRVFVPVAWFPTLRSGLNLSALRDAWQGRSATAVYASDETASAVAEVLGAPGPGVKRVPATELNARLWADPSALGIVPFDELNVKETALPLDGVNVLARDADLSAYPLAVRSWLSGDGEPAGALASALRAVLPATNRDTSRLSTLVMSGTTAITRATAWKIEQKHDPAYPARKIAPVLSKADIVHVSNEVSFVDGCVADPAPTFSFCSKPAYIETLQLIGTKIVGLTGNHLLDFGATPFLKTLDEYAQAGMRTYGGGRNASEAARPLIVTDHGNRLAFIGMNPAGPAGDWATAAHPGSQPYDAAALAAQMAEARQEADLVFVELQGEETYTYEPDYANLRMFRRTLADGADVVTGVQAHQPQAIEFSPERADRIILYGLGNLFFDQMWSEGTRQGIIVRHTVYQGRLLQSELLTTMLEDYAQPRWTTAAERERLLRAVFAASGFKEP